MTTTMRTTLPIIAALLLAPLASLHAAGPEAPAENTPQRSGNGVAWPVRVERGASTGV